MKLTAGSISVKIKANLSRRHLQTARLFSVQCRQIEEAEVSLPWPQPRFDEAGSFAAGAVVLSVAALEASINELYLEAADPGSDLLAPLTIDRKALLVVLWNEVERGTILGKYDIALAACGKPAFDRGGEPYQSAAGTIDLRNALVHFKPEWDTEQQWHAQLEKRLASRFPQSKLAANASGNMAWFPNRCLGGGCAEWACEAVQKFVTEFCARLGVVQRFPASTSTPPTMRT